MRVVTLLCAIVFTLSAAFAVYNLAQLSLRYQLPPVQYLGQGVRILGECSLAAFFFILYSRQK